MTSLPRLQWIFYIDEQYFNPLLDLVLIASERAREIRRQHKDSDKREHVHSIVTALEEIQAGKIEPRKYLNKVK